MSAISVSEQLYCAACSDPVDAVDERGFGRCCHELPNPWHRGSDGLYNRPSESEDAEDEDDEPDQRPTCPHCGSAQFRIHATERRLANLTQTVSSRDNDYDDGRLYYDHDDFVEDETETDDFEIRQVSCANCNENVTLDVEVEQI